MSRPTVIDDARLRVASDPAADDAERPSRPHPRPPDPARAVRRAVTLVLLTLVAPGAAQVAAGNRRVGTVALRVWAGLLGSVVLVGLGWVVARGAVLAVFTLPTVLSLLGVLLILPPAIYLGVSWIFSAPLIIDKGLDFWPAMELSRKVASKQFFGTFALLFLVGLIFLAGFIALCLGVFVSAPVALACIAVAYNELFDRT